MNDDLCRDFIFHLDKDNSLQCGEAPDNIQTWLEGLNLPLNLLRFMRWYWPQSDCKIAHYKILSSQSIYVHEVTPIFLEFDLLNIGWAPNGDWLVIDFSKEACEPGFIPFALWNPEATKLEDPRTSFQAISRSLDAFLYRAMEGLFLPFDSYAAENLNAFLEEEAEHAVSSDGHKPSSRGPLDGPTSPADAH